MVVKDSACDGSGVQGCIVIENPCIIINNTVRNRNMKGTSGEGSEGNEKHLETGGKAILGI